jgi:hypothetical protein
MHIEYSDEREGYRKQLYFPESSVLSYVLKLPASMQLPIRFYRARPQILIPTFDGRLEDSEDVR